MSDPLLEADMGVLSEFASLVPGGVLVVDDRGGLVWADDDATELFDLDRDDPSIPDVSGRGGERLPPAERPYMQVFETSEPVRDVSCQAALADGPGVVTVDAVLLSGDRAALTVDTETPTRDGADVLERVDDGFFALDRDWRFTYVNGRAESLLERSEAALLGENIWDAFPAAVDSRFPAEYERAMETQEPVAFDAYFPPLEEWFEVRAYPSETGLSVYFKGVTERKERERELEQYETILETIDDGVYIVDQDGEFRLVNEAYAEMVGREPEDLVGTAASTLVSDETAERAQEIHRELCETDTEQARLETDLETVDGDPLTAEATFTLIDQGDETWRVGVVRDITERKERERELAAQSRQQRAVAELGKHALGDTDLDAFLDRAASVVAAVLDNDYCKVLDLDADAGELTLRQGVGWDPGIVGAATVSATGDDSQAAYTLGQQEPVVVEDLAEDARFSGPDLLTDHDVTSGISVIIGSLEDPWGILGTHDTDRKAFDEHDVDFVRSVATLVAATIDNHDRRRSLEDATAAFRSASQISVRDEPVEERARDLLALGSDFLGLDTGFLTRIDAGTQTIELVAGDTGVIEEGVECPIEQAYCRTALDERGLVATHDASGSEWVSDLAYGTWDSDAYVGHVISVDGEPYGTIGFAGDETCDAFDDIELAFVEQIAQWMRYELSRRDRERKLTERRRRYRTLIDNLPNGAVVLFDHDLRYTTFGGSLPGNLDGESDVETERIDETLPEPLAAQVLPNYRATLNGEERQFVMTHDDELRTVHTTPITAEDGTVVAGMAISQDITERRERERKLRRQREQLSVLNDINSLVQDISETVIEQSDPAAVQSAIRTHLQESAFYRTAWVGTVGPHRETIMRATGSDAEDLPVDPPIDIEGDSVTAEAVRTGDMCVEQAVAADSVEAMAAIPLTFEGALYGVLTVFTSRTDAFGDAERTTLDRLGTIVAHAMLSIDREARLHRSERLYRRLAENIPNGSVTMVDTDLRYQVAAGELLEWVDIDGRDLHGKRPTEADALPEEGGRKVERACGAALEGETVSYRLAYGDHVIDAQTLPIWDEAEESVVGAMTLARDITERVEQQQELEHERERLELLIRLIRHNFLNSLNVVDARLNLIEGRVDYEVSDHLDTAQRRTGEMIDLVETIRNLTDATIDSDQHELEPVRVDRVLVDETESVAATYPGAAFTVGDLPPVSVAADSLLGEAFGNVLHNAVQHNDKETPQVTVDATATDETVTVSVADNGPGIPADLKESIFEKGIQGFQNPGTGFGLHIVREIVDTYGGEVAALDDDPEGTIFRITLDRADMAET
ncbi:PAS domain-containing protein [Haloplanus halobius]|uniref:PAS domain-containing protein n=1 Tax=Haloplanus halobius TaxID=2934938 RepID=UPI00200EC713|nr:PAS domain-containing protein [Haloplanus sp. XH21]